MKVPVIASEKNWIESNAIDQLNRSAQLAGVIAAAGMPDLHPGKDAPIGAVFATDSHIYPHLVDKDIGCGISLWQLDIKQTKIKADKLEKKLDLKIEGAWSGDLAQYMLSEGVARTDFDEATMGTIGYGNHFAELTKAKDIFDINRFEKMGLDTDALFLLVHSGSRGLGESIFYRHAATHGTGGLLHGSAEADQYIAAHNHALLWAKANRKLIAHRIMTAVSCNGNLVLDISHNHVLPGQIDGKCCWLHRKGAIPTDQGPAVIAGTRGTLSYLVDAGEKHRATLSTAAHGAGRKWRRGDCKGRLENRYSAQSLIKTELGSRVICEDKDLLYEEAPQAYKNIDVVIEDLLEAGAIKTIASFAPVLTYKKRKIESDK
ncbi:MAG: RNA ligase RtcB family protein [Candidatus Obscuribacterales bacterium]|nr:RNA ligase RtcB family protein [Candidatus Obscuribacterales bacterium]